MMLWESTNFLVDLNPLEHTEALELAPGVSLISFRPKVLPELKQKKSSWSTKFKVEIIHGLRTNEACLRDSTKVESHSLALLIIISVRSLRS